MMRLPVRSFVTACVFGLLLADLQAEVDSYTKYTRIPKTTSNVAGNAVVLPVKWKNVAKIYVKYAYDEQPSSWPMIVASTTDGVSAGSRANPWIGIQPTGSGPKLQYGSLSAVSGQLTPGDAYGPGLDAVHEATISFTCTVDNYFLFGCGWNNLVYHTTTDFYALKLYDAEGALLADMKPAVSGGVAGFVDAVSGTFYERADSSWTPFVAGPEINEMTVSGWPLELGVPEPDYGVWTNLAAGSQTARCPAAATNAEDTIRATCAGWTLQKIGGSPVPGSGTTATIPYDVSCCHARLTWIWENSFAVDQRTIVDGRIVETGRHWTAGGGSVTLTAPPTPSGCVFLGWCGSGVTEDNRYGSTLELSLSEPGAVSALFRTAELEHEICYVDNALGADEPGAAVFKTLAFALGQCDDQDTVALLPGLHPIAANVSVAKAVTIRGAGTPEETQIDGGKKDVGVSLSVSGATLRDLTLQNMSCANNWPLATSSGTVVSNCIVTACAHNYNWVVSLYDGLVTGCRFFGNMQTLGNLFRITNGTLENSLVTNNTLRAGFSWWGNNGTIRNTTIVNNTLLEGTYALPMGGETKIYNNIIWGNTNNLGVANWSGAGSTKKWINNCTTPLTGNLGSGNIESDPMFLSDGCHIKKGSPCNHGADVDTATTVDLDGRPRGDKPSIGAFEYVDLGELEVTISNSATFVRSPETITLTPLVVGTYSGTPTYSWDLKGDGSLIVTDEKPVLSAVGCYRPKLTVTVDGKAPVTVACGETLSIHSAGAQTYHVDFSAGDDAKDGMTTATAWKTLASALESPMTVDGDEIVLARGLHPLTVSVLVAKAVTIRGAGAPEETQIDGGAKDVGLTLYVPGATLRDLTVQNLKCSNNSPLSTSDGTVVSNCVLTALRRDYFTAMSFGGGLVTGCRMVANVCPLGSLAVITSATVENCLVTNNTAKSLINWYNNGGTLRNSTIVDNALIETTVAVNMSYHPAVCNNIVWGNTNANGVANWTGVGSTDKWTNNCTRPLTGVLGSGNIESDPMFLSDGCHIKKNSPCNHGANPAYASTIDFDGRPRGDAPSIGAFEYVDLGELEVSISASATFVRSPETITLEAVIEGTFSETPTYSWDLKGDGSLISTDAKPVLSVVGSYLPVLTLTIGSRPPVVVSWPTPLVIHSAGAQSYYVDSASGNDANDGMTPATAWKTLAFANESPMTVDGDEIVLARGLHPLTVSVLVAKAVTIRGAGAPEETQIDGGAKDVGLTLHVPGATLRDLTVQNLKCSNNAPLSTSDGTVVSNCILTALCRDYAYDVVMSGGLVTGCRIVSNVSLLGNLIQVRDYATVENCLLANNTTKGIITWWNNTGIVRNSTIVDNALIESNFAVNMGNKAAVHNNIIWGNTNANGVANWTGGGVEKWTHVCTSPTAGLPDSANFDADPLFSARKPYHLTVASPCRNAGSNELTTARVDLDGRPRKIGRRVDLGCYECEGPGLSVIVR